MLPSAGVDLAVAEMPQVDHRVGKGFERVVQYADPIEAQQRRFVAVTESDGLVTLDLLVAAETKVVSTFASRG